MSHHSSTIGDVELFHDSSKWEEPLGDPFLTLYDFHRKPRAVPQQDQRICLPVKVLHPDFRCPICCGYMKKTSVVMGCMHRFCEKCIQTSIRVAKKECPTCRIHVASRRNLRPDPRFDDLIQSVLGNVERQDRKETRQIELLNKAKAAKRKQQNIQYQEESRPKSQKERDSTSTKEKMIAQATSAAPSSPIHGFEPSPLVEFYLVRHPQERRLDSLLKDNLRVSGKAPISVLQTFLSRKLSYSPATDIQILFQLQGRFVVLNSTMKLRKVRRELMGTAPWQEVMVLYYRIHPAP